MSKLVIECDKDGEMFIYHEADNHHEITEPVRARNMERLDWDSIAQECRVTRGQYMVVPIVEVEE